MIMQQVFHGLSFGRFYFSFNKDKGGEFLSAVFAKHETFNFGAETGAIIKKDIEFSISLGYRGPGFKRVPQGNVTIMAVTHWLALHLASRPLQEG